ncbi:MAG: hypothetical protein F6K28_26080 [Microcoleus sp. SIO2G3]|nr:hypothetical protein [Microcoleus sp. SIO2G3]
MLNPSNNPSEQPQPRLPLIERLIHDYPLVFWGLLWAVLISAGSFATLRLLSAGPIEQEASAPAPTASTIQETPALPLVSTPNSNLTIVHKFTAKPDLPLSLIGAVALGCAGGSLLITQALRRTTNPRKAPKRLKSTPNSRKKRQNPSRKRRSAPKARQPVVSKPNLIALENQLPKIDNPLAQVTVLPPEESHPLDRGNQNLADLMDLRKRQSLASLMRGK